MNFVDGFKNIGNQTLSENLGVVYKSTGGGALLDLFATIGGMRNQPINEVIAKWRAAYKENSEYAANLILYTRSIRDGGIGERKIARALYKELAILEPEKVKRNFQTIVDTGRWDDLYSLEGTPCEDAMWEFIKNRLILDVTLMKENKPISLVSKWLKSINTSSAESRRIAKVFCAKTGLTLKTYRKTLSRLRAYLKVTEVAMSANQWKLINFEAVPSLAMSRYNKAFRKHTPIEFQTYLEGLQKGTVKINAATLNPSDICKKYLNRCLEATDIAQWNSLPNYVSGEHEVLCLSDVSGSMTWPNYEPMAASIGLATYFAQRNKGSYHGMYLTFTDTPHFVNLDDNWNIEKCFEFVKNKGIGYHTNMDGAFKAIYDVAIATHDSPKALVVISDGEVDSWVRSNQSQSIVSKWKQKFNANGLDFPRVISWNVACRNGTVIAPASDGVSFVSGYGAGPFKNLVELIELNAEEAMIKILTKPEFTWK